MTVGCLTGVMGAPPTLHTARLVLRPFAISDLEAMTALMSHPKVQTALHLPAHTGGPEAFQALVVGAGLWEIAGFGQWALEERSTGRFVGRAGLYVRAEPDWPGVEVGWALDPSWWGRGYATEAGEAAVRFGFDDVGVDSLVSVILPENEASSAVARRLGFVLADERTLSHFPAMPHGVWRLDRAKWEAGDR